MELNENTVKEFLSFQIKRKTTDLTKNFLFILEDLQLDGYNIPDDKFQRIRKRCLDNLNDSLRDLDGVVSKLNITL